MKRQKSNETRISEAEWRVMEVLWELKEARPAEVIAALESESDWNHRTIRTLLSRLQKKGAVKAIESGSHNRYAPALSREQCLRIEQASFIRRFFGGDVSALMTHFVKSEPLESQDIDTLRALLGEAEKSTNRNPKRKSK